MQDVNNCLECNLQVWLRLLFFCECSQVKSGNIKSIHTFRNRDMEGGAAKGLDCVYTEEHAFLAHLAGHVHLNGAVSKQSGWGTLSCEGGPYSCPGW